MKNTISKCFAAVWVVVSIQSQCCGQDVPNADGTGIYEVPDSSFNEGNIHHPQDLIRGQTPGTFISKPGADPVGTHDIRIRGISTLLAPAEPLFVIDGIRVPSLSVIDPLDIKGISILSGAESAIYGIQGGAGIIQVTTKKGSKGPVRVSYRTFGSVESKIHKQKALGAGEYLEVGGNDIGGRTDWMEEITRRGGAMVHGLSISGGNDRIDYRGSVNKRNIWSIQKGTDVNRINAFSSVRLRLMEDQLNVGFLAGMTSESGSLGFQEAFKYAMTMIPTMPVFRTDGSGEFFHPTQYDLFNPVALIRSNEKNGQRDQFWNQLNIQYELGPVNFMVYSGWSQDDKKVSERYVSEEGQIVFRESEQFSSKQINTNTLLGSRFTYALKTGRWGIRGLIQYERQQINQQSRTIRSSNFFATRDGTRDNVHLNSYTARVNIDFDHKWQVRLTNRVEGSSALATNHQWGHFYSISSSYDLSDWIGEIGSLSFSTGYGTSGRTPYLDGLSKLSHDDSTDPPTVNHQDNDHLTYEKSRLFDIGLNFKTLDGRFAIGIERYFKESSDLIGRFFPDMGPVYLNFGEIRNKGWQVVVDFSAHNTGSLKYYSRFIMSTLSTKWSKTTGDFGIDLNGTSYGPAGGPGYGSTQFIAIEKGKPFGSFYGPVVEDFSSLGEWKLRDLDGNGQTCFTCSGDFTTLGNALPRWQMGWTHDLRYGKWGLNFMITGLFGHELVNLNRLFYQVVWSGNSYNILSSWKELSPSEYNPWSDRFVETASYLRLDYLTVDYDWKPGFLKSDGRIRIYISANNLFTLTSYSGNDPEVRLADIGPAQAGGRLAVHRDPFSPGIDRKNQWLPSRSVTAGMDLIF